jgi:hypothetical protein
MKRTILLVLVWSVAFTMTGCDGKGAFRFEGNYAPPYYDDYCGQFSSCEQCTPMEGCGWCSYGRNQGFCFSEPNECRPDRFSWTWVPAGCENESDSGAATQDASVPNDGGDDSAFVDDGSADS